MAQVNTAALPPDDGEDDSPFPIHVPQKKYDPKSGSVTHHYVMELLTAHAGVLSAVNRMQSIRETMIDKKTEKEIVERMEKILNSTMENRFALSEFISDLSHVR